MSKQGKKCRTSKDIGNDHRVRSIHMEWECGERHWWVYLARGWRWVEETHTIHELTIPDVVEALAGVAPCRCHLCLDDHGHYGEPLPDNLDGLDPEDDYRDLPTSLPHCRARGREMIEKMRQERQR